MWTCTPRRWRRPRGSACRWSPCLTSPAMARESRTPSFSQMEKAKRECMQMEPMFDFPGHGEGVQNPFLRPNNNPFEKLTRGGDFSDLQSLWRSKREASEGLVDVDEDDFYEFLQQVNDNRHFRHNAMGNLTCVLHKCGQLTEDMA